MGLSKFFAQFRSQPKEITPVRQAPSVVEQQQYSVAIPSDIQPYWNKDGTPRREQETTWSDKRATKRRSFWRSASTPMPETQRPQTAGGPLKHKSYIQLQSGALTPGSSGSRSPGRFTEHMDTSDAASIKSKRKSVSRRKSNASVIKRRMSWLGGKPDSDDEELPAVPAIPTALPAMPKPKQYRYVNIATGQQVAPPSIAALSVEPPMDYNSQYPASITEKERPKSRRKSLTAAFSSRSRSKSNVSMTSMSKKRSSWFHSSNPDYDSDIPAVPALVRDGYITPDSTGPQTDSEASGITRDPIASTSIYATNEPKFSRPVSSYSTNSHRSYTGPKSAAKSFLQSTTETSEATRRSWRRSQQRLYDTSVASAAGSPSPNVPRHRESTNRASTYSSTGSIRTVEMVCMNDEQQREWDKLKALMQTLEEAQEDGVMGMLREMEDDDGNGEEEGWWRGKNSSRRERRASSISSTSEREGTFDNKQALAALECGVAR